MISRAPILEKILPRRLSHEVVGTSHRRRSDILGDEERVNVVGLQLLFDVLTKPSGGPRERVSEGGGGRVRGYTR